MSFLTYHKRRSFDRPEIFPLQSTLYPLPFYSPSCSNSIPTFHYILPMCRQSSILTSHISYFQQHISTFSQAPLVLVFPPIPNCCPSLELHHTLEPLCPCLSAGYSLMWLPPMASCSPWLRPPSDVRIKKKHASQINSHKNSSQV